MKKLLIIILLLSTLLFSACVNPDKTTSLLSSKGYTNIEITGYNPFACSDDDFYQTGFKATNPNGMQEKGTLCCGLFFKGCTIRN